MKTHHSSRTLRSSRSSRPGRTLVLRNKPIPRLPSAGNHRAHNNVFFTETPTMASTQANRFHRDDISPVYAHWGKPGNPLEDSANVTPHSSINHFRPLIGVSSQSTLDPDRGGGFKTLLRGRATVTPHAATLEGQHSPLSLLRDHSFYRELMSSRTSVRAGGGVAWEELKHRTVLESYRQSKHSLFTLVQNELSKHSMEQIDDLDLQRRLGDPSQDEEDTTQSLIRLNGEYKQMQNQLNKLINGGQHHTSLHDGATVRFVVERNNCLFLKVERKNPLNTALRVVAKLDYGEARLYASAVFEFPNYANNGLKTSNLGGEPFYFHPEDKKTKCVYLSIEAGKKSAIVLQAKFVRLADSQKKFEPNLSMLSEDIPKKDTETVATPSGMSLFKAFMQGKLDEQTRLEVLAKAKAVRLEKMRATVYLKDKLQDDLRAAANRSQKMRRYFQEQRMKGELVRKRKEEKEATQRRHKVALMNKMEITRYLREQDNLRLLKLRRSQYFLRNWLAAAHASAALTYISEIFGTRRDEELRRQRAEDAATRIQRCWRRFQQRWQSQSINQRAVIHFRAGQRVRAAVIQDLARQKAAGLVFKVLSDGRRIEVLSERIRTFADSIMKIQLRWKQKAERNEERTTILKYYVDRLCDLYLSLKKKKISDMKLKKRIDKKITRIMSYDEEYLRHQLKVYILKKKGLYLRHRQAILNRMPKAPYDVQRLHKTLQFLGDWLPEDGLENYEQRLESKLQTYFQEHYKKYISKNPAFFKRQGTMMGLVERATSKRIQEDTKLMEAQTRTSRGLTFTPAKRRTPQAGSRLGSSAKQPSRTLKSSTKESAKEGEVVEPVVEPAEEEKAGGSGGAAGGSAGVEYERYVRELVRRGLYIAKFDFVPEVEELEELLKL